MENKKTAAIGLRLTEEFKEVLAAIAKRETRSLSQQIEFFVRQGLKKYLADHPDFKKKIKNLPDL